MAPSYWYICPLLVFRVLCAASCDNRWWQLSYPCRLCGEKRVTERKCILFLLAQQQWSCLLGSSELHLHNLAERWGAAQRWARAEFGGFNLSLSGVTGERWWCSWTLRAGRSEQTRSWCRCLSSTEREGIVLIWCHVLFAYWKLRAFAMESLKARPLERAWTSVLWTVCLWVVWSSRRAQSFSLFPNRDQLYTKHICTLTLARVAAAWCS